MHLFLAAKLAWSNTTANWQRLFVRCSGVTFAVVLMFMQTGFRNALFDSNVRIMEEKISADVVIRIKSRFMLSSGQQMPFQYVVTARSCEGVAAAEPLYIENMMSEWHREGTPKRKIRVLGFRGLGLSQWRPGWLSLEQLRRMSKARPCSNCLGPRNS